MPKLRKQFQESAEENLDDISEEEFEMPLVSLSRAIPWEIAELITINTLVKYCLDEVLLMETEERVLLTYPERHSISVDALLNRLKYEAINQRKMKRIKECLKREGRSIQK